MEPTIGIEPMNLFLTKEVLYLLSYVGLSQQQAVLFQPAATPLGTPWRFGGGGRIRTSEGFAGRFTVCSLWPLGNPTTMYILSGRWPGPCLTRAGTGSAPCPGTGLQPAGHWLELAMGIEPATC